MIRYLARGSLSGVHQLRNSIHIAPGHAPPSSAQHAASVSCRSLSSEAAATQHGLTSAETGRRSGAAVKRRLRRAALAAYQALGCRQAVCHGCDFDSKPTPWLSPDARHRFYAPGVPARRGRRSGLARPRAAARARAVRPAPPPTSRARLSKARGGHSAAVSPAPRQRCSNVVEFEPETRRCRRSQRVGRMWWSGAAPLEQIRRGGQQMRERCQRRVSRRASGVSTGRRVMASRGAELPSPRSDVSSLPPAPSNRAPHCFAILIT